jgi:hypothetical protein
VSLSFDRVDKTHVYGKFRAAPKVEELFHENNDLAFALPGGTDCAAKKLDSPGLAFTRASRSFRPAPPTRRYVRPAALGQVAG